MDAHHQIVEDIKNKYLNENSARAMFLVGSVARGDYTPVSDIDIVLITSQESENKFEEFVINNLTVEITKRTLQQYIEKIKEDPLKIWQIAEALPLFDKDGAMKILKDTAREVKNSYTPKNFSEITNWLSSAKIKIESAKVANDKMMVGYLVSNVLWKIVQGLYGINKLPTPAGTFAYRNISTLLFLPDDFSNLWTSLLVGDVDSRGKATTKIIDFILEHGNHIK